MTKYNKLKEKYFQLFKETFSKNKDILIESFIEYYGEKHRKLIEDKFDKLVFACYFNIKSIIVDKYYCKEKEYKSKYKIFSQIINSYFFDILFNKYCILNRPNTKKYITNNKIPNEFIGITGKVNTEDYNLIIKQISKLKTTYICSLLPKEIIVFPIFTEEEWTLIHEINHSIVSSLIGGYQYKKIFTYNYNLFKSGLCTNDDDYDHEQILEELINEKSSYDILKIFKNKGGGLTSIC